MTGQLPQFGLKGMPVEETVRQTNQSASTVFAMIESGDAVERADDIAAVEGVDVDLIGSLDLSIELGVPAQFNSEKYRTAITTVSQACRKHGKIFGLAGIYDNPELQGWAINELGVRFMLVQQDTSLIASGGKKAAVAVPAVCS
jgi:2-keto-3-deoxy-L-rhamnonate aldolase RhmA